MLICQGRKKWIDSTRACGSRLPIIALALRLCAVGMIPYTLTRPANAAQVTANFTVTITILKQCTIAAPTNINFGSVGSTDPISTATTASQSFSVTCSPNTAYSIGFSSPNDAPAGGSTHVMKGTGGNTDIVSYQLTDTTVGATNSAPLSASSSVIAGTGTGVAQTKTLQAKVINYTAPVAADTYSDTVTMTVTY